MKTVLRREGGRVRGGKNYYDDYDDNDDDTGDGGGSGKERNIISIVHILIYVYTMYLQL
jgi:hypothetical protein